MALIGDSEETKLDCIANALRITEYARRLTRGHPSFPGPGSEKKWHGTHVNKADGEWEKTARKRTSCFPCYQRTRKRRIEAKVKE